MTKLLRSLVVAILMIAVLCGTGLTAHADPTPCTVGCDGGH